MVQHTMCVWYLLEGVQILQGLLGGLSQARHGAGREVADSGLEVRVEQRGAQQEQRLLLQQHRLQEAQRVETHLPVSICPTEIRGGVDAEIKLSCFVNKKPEKIELHFSLFLYQLGL